MNNKYLFHVVLACLIISALPVFAEISPAYLRIGSSMEDSVLVEVSTSGVKVASDIESLEKAEIKPALVSNLRIILDSSEMTYILLNHLSQS